MGAVSGIACSSSNLVGLVSGDRQFEDLDGVAWAEGLSVSLQAGCECFGSCLSVSVEHTGPRCCLGHLPNQCRGDHQNPLPDGQCYGRSIVRVEGLVSAKI